MHTPHHCLSPSHLDAHHERPRVSLPAVKKAGPLKADVGVVEAELLPGVLARSNRRGEFVNLVGLFVVAGFVLGVVGGYGGGTRNAKDCVMRSIAPSVNWIVFMEDRGSLVCVSHACWCEDGTPFTAWALFRP